MARKVHPPPKLLHRLATALIVGAAVLLSAGLLATPARATANVYDVAYLGSNGDLWYYDGTTAAHDTRLGMDTASSPAIVFDDVYGIVIAFESNADILWFYQPGTGHGVDTGISMKFNTSPSLSVNGVVAFEGQNGDLWYTDVDGGPAVDTRLGMNSNGTSPSIEPNGTKIAFKSSSNILWVYDTQTHTGTDTGLGMNISSSPSIGLDGNGLCCDVAFEANTNILWYYNGSFGVDTGLHMEPYTSPSIEPFGDELITFADNANRLNVYSAATKVNTATLLGLAPYTSPTIGPMIDSGTGQVTDYRAWFDANGSHDLYFFSYGGHSSGNTGALIYPSSSYDGHVSFAAGVRLHLG